MVDTIRTLAYLRDTAFVDAQPVGSITPQDMRDLIVSMGPLSGALNVKDFPYLATGDGVTNDWPAVKAAIQAADAAGGGQVFFPPGTYHFATWEQLININNVEIIGAGRSTIFTTLTTFHAIFDFLDGSFLNFLNFFVSGIAGSAGTVAVRMEDCTDGLVDRVMMTTGNSGVRLIGSDIGVGVYGNQRHRVVNCQFKGLSGTISAGIAALQYTRDVVIANNIVDGTDDEGISADFSAEIAGRPQLVTITGNVVKNTGRSGIQVYGAQRVSVTGNITDNCQRGIAVSQDTDVTLNEYVSVSGNVVENSLVDGIRVANALYCAVDGNTINTVVQGDGIKLGGTSQEADFVSVTGNVISDVQNDLGGSTSSGIRLKAGRGNTVVANTIYGNGKDILGIKADAPVSRNEEHTVVGNTIIDVASDALKIESEDTKVSGNRPIDTLAGSGALYNVTGAGCLLDDAQFSANRGDASVTLAAGVDAEIQPFDTALTANRSVTLSTTKATFGHKFRIVRTGLGSFTLDVGGLKTIPSATAAFVEVAWDGSAWVLTGYGTL